MSDNQTKIEADDAVPNSVHIVVMSWFSHVLNDPFVKQWFGWLMTPVVLAFIIPLALILFIYISILILYINRVHHRRLRRRLREAVTERDILKAGRDIVAALWDGQVQILKNILNLKSPKSPKISRKQKFVNLQRF